MEFDLEDLFDTRAAGRSDEEQEALERHYQMMSDRVDRFLSALPRWVYVRILGQQSLTDPPNWDDYVPEEKEGAFDLMVALFKELNTRLEKGNLATPSDDTSGTNGTGVMSKPPPGRSDTRVKPPGRSSKDRPGKGKEDRMPSAATSPDDSSTTSGGSFASSVPYFEWVCAFMVAIAGFIVASITSGMLHYNGTLDTIVTVGWHLIITVIAGWMGYGVGKHLNRESDNG